MHLQQLIRILRASSLPLSSLGCSNANSTWLCMLNCCNQSQMHAYYSGRVQMCECVCATSKGWHLNTHMLQVVVLKTQPAGFVLFVLTMFIVQARGGRPVSREAVSLNNTTVARAGHVSKLYEFWDVRHYMNSF